MNNLLIPCPSCGKRLRVRDPRFLGQRVECPKCGARFVLELTASANGSSATPAADSPRSDSPGTAIEKPTSNPPAMVLDIEETDAAGARRLERLRQQAKRRRMAGLVVTLVVTLAAAGIFVAARLPLSGLPNQTAPEAAPSGPVQNTKEVQNNPASTSPAEDGTSNAEGTEPPFPSGPIRLRLVPSGARIVIHVRPSQFWKTGTVTEQVRLCLGPLGLWLADRLHDVCRLDPERIDEAMVCIALGAVGTPPEVSATIRLTEAADRTDLLRELGGERAKEFKAPVYYAGEAAYFVADDLTTIAICPRGRVEEMLASRNTSALTTQGIEQLLPLTDRTRLASVIFETQDIRRHVKDLVPPEQTQLFGSVLDWLSGDDVETVGIGIQLDGRFKCDVVLRNRNVVPIARLQSDVKQKMDDLPAHILQIVQSTSPATVGGRRVIGRFPAMTKVFTTGTRTEAAVRHASLQTILPERAGPNLALAAVLVWNELLRPGAPANRSSKPAEGSPRAQIADRLAMKIDVDYRRTPLQEAFDYIGEATGTRFVIDGESLKLAGYTKNMPQTFKMDNIPATRALYEITYKYDKMVIVIDEEKQVVTVLTRSAAEKNGWTPFPLGPSN